VARGATGGPGFSTNVVTLGSGSERRNIQWANARGEHWTVVIGTATVTVGERVVDLVRSESIDIPKGEKASARTEPIEIIEVKFRDYLGEDDILRYEDIYKRV
jgi:mannose-6-phosphate isomerase